MKFNVTIKAIEIYMMQAVEAETEEEAIANALEMYDEDKNKYFHDSDGEEEAYEVEEDEEEDEIEEQDEEDEE